MVAGNSKAQCEIILFSVFLSLHTSTDWLKRYSLWKGLWSPKVFHEQNFLNLRLSLIIWICCCVIPHVSMCLGQLSEERAWDVKWSLPGGELDLLARKGRPDRFGRPKEWGPVGNVRMGPLSVWSSAATSRGASGSCSPPLLSTQIASSLFHNIPCAFRSGNPQNLEWTLEVKSSKVKLKKETTCKCRIV